MAGAAYKPASSGDRVARNLCRRESPDLFFATHFLPKPQRHAIYTLRAVCRQLQQVLDSGQKDLAAPTTIASECADCEETPEQRREVCASVLDFLYAGQKTGKPELDGFSAIVKRHAIPRGLFDDMIDGMAALVNLKLYATWSRLRGVSDRAAGSAAMIAFRALAASHEEISPAVEQQARAWGVAIHLTAILAGVGEDWRRGRVLLPLDDLVKFGLERADIGRFTEAGSAGTDPRWQALIRFESERVQNLYRGGAGCLRVLPPQSRRAMAVFGEMSLGRLASMERGELNPFGKPATTTLWSRLARVPHAFRAAAM